MSEMDIDKLVRAYETFLNTCDMHRDAVVSLEAASCGYSVEKAIKDHLKAQERALLELARIQLCLLMSTLDHFRRDLIKEYSKVLDVRVVEDERAAWADLSPNE
jgi:hypothetical protein